MGIVITIGLADSLNPSTIAPALYLASGQRARERVSEFTLGVFVVYLLGGLAITLGPGRLLFSLLPHPHHHGITHAIEIAAGVAMIGAGAVLWRHRTPLGRRHVPDIGRRYRSSAVLGATITAVELPTAFPYFAALAAVAASDIDPLRQFLLIVLFNVCFVLPLLGIIATLTFGGANADRLLTIGRQFLDRHWPVLLAGLAVTAGALVVFLGATGIASGGHGHFARLMGRLRRAVRP